MPPGKVKFAPVVEFIKPQKNPEFWCLSAKELPYKCWVDKGVSGLGPWSLFHV